MNIGHVEGGTHAGWRKANPPHEPWLCPNCRLDNPGYRNQCGKCNDSRPTEVTTD